MLRDLVDRVQRRLDALGITATEASREAGLSADAIRNMQRAAQSDGARIGVSTHTVTSLAKVLQTTAGWLMDGRGDEQLVPPTVPLVGYVGAGALAHFYELSEQELDRVEAPEGSTSATRAAEIRGTSLGPLFERWLIFYDDVRSPVTDDLIGRLCIVGLQNGKVLVKKLRKGKIAGTYDLLSNAEDPMENQDIEWAARVKQMTPR